MTTRLSVNQIAILSSAAARPDGSLLPLPDDVALSGKALDRTLSALVRRGFATEAGITEDAPAADPAEKRAVVITPRGCSALGSAPEEDATEPMRPEPPTITSAPLPAALSGKLDLVLQAVSSNQGATLGELVAATSWLNHTTRAALTRLRQRGFDIGLEDAGGRRVYRLHQAA